MNHMSNRSMISGSVTHWVALHLHGSRVPWLTVYAQFHVLSVFVQVHFRFSSFLPLPNTCRQVGDLATLNCLLVQVCERVWFPAIDWHPIPLCAQCSRKSLQIYCNPDEDNVHTEHLRKKRRFNPKSFFHVTFCGIMYVYNSTQEGRFPHQIGRTSTGT